jgi:hypothetical protein
MKKVLLTILMSMGVLTAHSQVMLPTHYDSEHTAKHIMKGHLKMYLMDSVKVVTEKKNERYIIDCGIDLDRVKAKVDKIFAKGKPEYISRTNGGYIFTIAIADREDDIKVINYVTFHVDAFTQKIEEIEILLGE